MSRKNVAFYALTNKGAQLAAKLAAEISPEVGTLFLPSQCQAQNPDLRAKSFDRLGEALAENFSNFSGHVIIGATGIVVRLIAPLISSKKEDPAVVVLPQDGKFAISLLAGHLGGANELALKLAKITGGQAVISTATDVENLPALEVLARDLGLKAVDLRSLAAISRLLVDGMQIPVYDPHNYLLPSLAPWAERFQRLTEIPAKEEPYVAVDYRLWPHSPQALILAPPLLALGLGCHRGIDPGEVADFVCATLKEQGYAHQGVGLLATVETRSSEPAFLALAESFNCPLKIWTKDELATIATPNPSNTVLARIGVPSVCEAAALLAAETDSLLIKKQKSSRATLAATVLKS